MAFALCTRHPEEKLRFLCTTCATAICRDCKLTQHEGHPTKDLDLAAPDLRQKLQQEKQEVDQCAKAARLLREKVRSSLTSLDLTVEETRSVMSKKVDAVVEWAKTYRLVMDSKLKQMKLEAKGEMESFVEYLDENVRYFEQMNSAMSRALGGEANDHHVARLYAAYEQRHKGRYPAAWELNAGATGHAWIVTGTGSSPDSCQMAIERYVGLPRLGRVLKTVPPTSQWSFVTRVRPDRSNDLHRVVSDILPMSNGSVSVLYRQSQSPGPPRTSRLAHYSRDGLKRAEEVIEDGEVVLVEPASCPLALFLVSSERWQKASVQLSASTDDSSQVGNPTAVVYLKRGRNNSTSVCEVTYPASGQSARSSVEVVQLDIPDALRAATSADGRYVAVLRKCNQVKVFERRGGPSGASSSALSTLDVTSELERAKFKDVCFGRVQDREVLLVAEGFYNVVLIADHLNGCVLTSFLPSPLPQLACVRADVAGSLWLGCEKGEVVVGVPIRHRDEPEEEEEEDVDLEEDTEGYLVPSVDLYVNIKALIQEPEPEPADLPPKRPPREGLPQLPPKSSSSTSRPADGDPLGLPLSPPGKPPSCLHWRRSPDPALEKRIQNLLGRPREDDAMQPPRQRKESLDSPQQVQPFQSSAGSQGPSYENVETEPTPEDGEPGCARRKPLSPPQPASDEDDHKEYWAPGSQAKAQPRPFKPGNLQPERPPKPGDRSAAPKGPEPKLPPKLWESKRLH